MAVPIDRERSAHAAPRPRIAHPRTSTPRVRPARPRVVVRSLSPSAWPLVGWMIRGYQAANASDLAAAVAFNALAALVPTSLLLVSVAGLFLQSDRVLVTAIYASVWALPPAEAQDALKVVLTARQNSGWFGAASLLGFAWIGTNVVSCLARSMNRVYAVPNCGFVCERQRGFFVVVVFAALFLLASLAATVPTLFVRRDVGLYFETWSISSSRVQVVSYGVALAAALALFAVIYRVVPNAGQRLADVWPGALTAALLFVAMTQVFPLYLRVVGGGNRFGAGFGFVSLLIAWFYALAHVLLFGTHVNATYQRRRRTGITPSRRPHGS